MPIRDYTTVAPWSGMLPQATPAMNPMEIEQMRGQQISNMDKMYDYQEKLKDIENRQKERELESEQLDFQKQNINARLSEERTRERMQFRDQQSMAIVNEMDTATRSEQDYMDVWGRHDEDGSLPDWLRQEDGSPVPFNKAKTLIPKKRNEFVNSVDQQKKMDLARLNIAGRLSQIGFSDVNTTGQELAAANNVVDAAAEQNEWDFGKYDDDMSDRRYLSTVIAEATTMKQRQAARKGDAVNADRVRQTVLNALGNSGAVKERNAKGNFPGAGKWKTVMDFFGTKNAIDRSTLNDAIDKALGFNGEFGKTISDKYGSEFVSGPVGVLAPDRNPAKPGSYNSPESVRDAYRRGELTEEQARSIIEKQFPEVKDN